METGSFLFLALALHEKIKIPRSHVFVKSKEPLSSMTGNEDIGTKVARSINGTNCYLFIYYLFLHSFPALCSSVKVLQADFVMILRVVFFCAHASQTVRA